MLVEAVERHGALAIAPALRAQLLVLSPATLDRLLGPGRRRLGRQPRGRRAGPGGLRGQVPLRTFGEWQGVPPGALQGDLVLHCGESTAGFYLSSLVAVDVATSWTELEAIWGIGQHRVRSGVHRVRQRLPFRLQAWHTDNGGEFLNRILVPWCRREGIRVTRGRDYRKNDQAWVEQKNWLAVRRLVGYDRYGSRAAYAVLQRLYRLLRWRLNFLRPGRKLLAKRRVGAKVLKRYDRAQTPYQRLLASGVLPAAQREALAREFQALNPLTLAREIDQTLDTLWKLREAPAGRTQAQLG
jgi:hypothetical protein